MAAITTTPFANAQELEQTLFPPDTAFAFKFASSIQVEGDTLVVADRGYRADNGTCASIDDGAVHVYKRTSANEPWPEQPAQTFHASRREAQMGENIALNGNTLIISESRTAAPGSSQSDGAFYYYSRADENSPFQLIETVHRPPDAEADHFTHPGLTSNGNYVVAVSQGSEPNIGVYELDANGATHRYSIAHTGQTLLQFHDALALTADDVLVVAQRGSNQIYLYQLSDTGATAIDSSALTLSNPSGETGNAYTGQIAVDGGQVVLAAERQSTAPAPNDLLTYYVKVFDLQAGAVQDLRTIEIPSAFNLAADYQVPRDGLGVSEDHAVFVNLSGATFAPDSNTLHTLIFEPGGDSEYELAADIDMASHNSAAGIGHHPNYGRPVVYDGHDLYVGDSLDATNEDDIGCAVAQGSVRIFSYPKEGGPTTVCWGQTGVQYTFAPEPNATAYSWWSEGATAISFDENTAAVDFGDWFTDTTINMDVTLSVEPYFVRRTLTVSASDCVGVPGQINGPSYLCAGQQAVVFTTDAPAGAVNFSWWSPGATSVTSDGPAGSFDFGTWSSQTTVNVDIQLSLPPWFETRSAAVLLDNCGG